MCGKGRLADVSSLRSPASLLMGGTLFRDEGLAAQSLRLTPDNFIQRHISEIQRDEKAMHSSRTMILCNAPRLLLRGDVNQEIDFVPPKP